MKKNILTLLFIVFASSCLYGQEENDLPPDISVGKSESVKNFDGFLLDIKPFVPLKLPELNFDNFIPSYSSKFQFVDPKFTIYRVNSMTLPYGLNSYYGLNGFFPSSQNLLMSSFQLNDNIRLNTYGQYTMDGKKLPDTTGLPWNKNAFMGGMELKFNNNFRIRVDVRRGNDPMYPY